MHEHHKNTQQFITKCVQSFSVSVFQPLSNCKHHTHTHLAELDKDNRLGNNLQSYFSQAFEDICKETDHYSCNAPTNTEKMGNERKDNKRTGNKGKRQEGRKRDKMRQREREKSQIWLTWHQQSVRFGQGQRSAVSNPLCPLP